MSSPSAQTVPSGSQPATPAAKGRQQPRTPANQSWQTQPRTPGNSSSPQATPGLQPSPQLQGNSSPSSPVPGLDHSSNTGPFESDFSTGGRAPSRSRSRRRRRSRRRPSNANFQQQDLDSSPPIPAIPVQHITDHTIPAGFSSSTYEIPYFPVQNPNLAPQQQMQQIQQLQQLQALQAALQSQNQNSQLPDNINLPRNQQRNQQSRNLPARQRAPTAEHPVQVPVRVVNPDDIPGVAHKAGDGGKGGGNLRLRLDLNLDVEITLKASIRGDLTLALL